MKGLILSCVSPNLTQARFWYAWIIFDMPIKYQLQDMMQSYDCSSYLSNIHKCILQKRVSITADLTFKNIARGITWRAHSVVVHLTSFETRKLTYSMTNST